MAIITTVGIDQKNNLYSITLKETVPKKEENKITNDYKYYKAKGNTMEEAIFNVEKHVSKDLYFKQVQNIIVTDQVDLKKIPKMFHGHVVLFQTHELEKVLKTNSNYIYLNNLAKEKTVTLKDIRKNPQKKIPYLKVYKEELLIRN